MFELPDPSEAVTRNARHGGSVAFMRTLKQPQYFSSFEVLPEFDDFIPVSGDSRADQELFRGLECCKAVGQAIKADFPRSERGWEVSFQYVELRRRTEQVDRCLVTHGRSRIVITLLEDCIGDTTLVMQDFVRLLDVDPARYPRSAFEAVPNPFEASRGMLARKWLRLRPVRIWPKCT